MTATRNSFTAEQVAEAVNGRLAGRKDVTVNGLSALADAEPNHVSFLGNRKYVDQVLPSKAGVVLVPQAFEPDPPEGRAWVYCDDPSAQVTTLALMFAPPPVEYAPGCHESAVIHPSATVAESAHIGACAVIDADAAVGENTVVGAGSYIGRETVVGADTLIYPNVTIRERCRVGNRVIVHSGTTIGSDGFGFIPGKDRHEKIPQVGTVQIDDDVEIGANVGVDRARFGKTWIKAGTKIDNLVQVGHNVVIGENCFVVSQAGVAGSTSLGRGVVVAGQVGIAGHLTIGDGAVLMAQSGIASDVEAGKTVFGSPAVEKRDYARRSLAIQRIPKLVQQVKELQKEVEALKQQLSSEE